MAPLTNKERLESLENAAKETDGKLSKILDILSSVKIASPVKNIPSPIEKVMAQKGLGERTTKDAIMSARPEPRPRGDISVDRYGNIEGDWRNDSDGVMVEYVDNLPTGRKAPIEQHNINVSKIHEHVSKEVSDFEKWQSKRYADVRTINPIAGTNLPKNNKRKVL